jgi:hypothetical protein
MIIKPASSHTTGNNDFKTSELSKYPRQVLNYYLENIAGDQFDVVGAPSRNLGTEDIAIWINGITHEGIAETTLDLSTTGLSGRVDGMTFTAGDEREFLIWSFANEANTEFIGFGLSHKPYSTFSAITVGGGKGTDTTITVPGTGNKIAYQFTVGARVVLRNTVGTSPLYEWNWGTIKTINSSTSITITMDNDTYGTALTGATGGEIKQWDRFRPWVVTTSDQTLYYDNYRLLGELQSTSSGNVGFLWKVDDPWRQVDGDIQFYNSTAAQTGATIYIGRIIPIWSKFGNIIVIVRTNTAGRLFEVETVNGFAQLYGQTQVGGIIIRQAGMVGLGRNASVFVTGNHADITVWQNRITSYFVPGGMRP